jgi:hypothetical protein
MPVIGRLNGQVDEVIIKPISERRREQEPPPPPEGTEAPERPPSAPTQTPHTDESSAKPDELPVWLL